MNFKYQIFISSTYKDLVEERQVAINKVMKLHQIPAGMELFGATGIDQWEYIKEEIDNSDYYLLILAGKYGSLNHDGISYTEHEYDYARKTGKHIIAFLVKDIEALPNYKCDNETRQKEHLMEFRARIEKEAGLVAYWTDIHDLEAKIGESLANVMRLRPAKTRWVRESDEISCEEDVEYEDDDTTLFPRLEHIQVREPEVNYDVNNPSKAVVICESSYIQLETRDGRIEKYMIDTCKEFVKLLKERNKYMKAHEILCLRNMWFNSISPEVIVSIDYLYESCKEPSHTVGEIKKFFYDGQVLSDGECYGILVRKMPVNMGSDHFFINNKEFYENGDVSSYLKILWEDTEFAFVNDEKTQVSARIKILNQYRYPITFRMEGEFEVVYEQGIKGVSFRNRIKAKDSEENDCFTLDEHEVKSINVLFDSDVVLTREKAYDIHLQSTEQYPDYI